MDAIEKDLHSRKKEIQDNIEQLFKDNISYTDWDVPEADDTEVANILLNIFKETINKIESDVQSGKYINF